MCVANSSAQAEERANIRHRIPAGKKNSETRGVTRIRQRLADVAGGTASRPLKTESERVSPVAVSERVRGLARWHEIESELSLQVPTRRTKEKRVTGFVYYYAMQTDPMEEGGRITSEEKATLSTYVGIIVLTVLVAVGIYVFILSRARHHEVTGFDPNRPVPSDGELQTRLKTEEYFVVREGGTQNPFENEFWNNDRAGLYVDVITGEPLFTSVDKYDSASGVLTFTKPISKDLLVEKLDTSHDMQRTEVVAKRSNAHLGHLFPDPNSPTGQRYSLNSAAFHFVPVERIAEDGYRTFLPLLEKK